jgi:hypothetical protein
MVLATQIMYNFEVTQDHIYIVEMGSVPERHAD